MNKRGQIFSWDLLIAVALFIFILMASLYMWEFYREKTELVDLRADMEFNARNGMVSLLTTSGNPTNWNTQPIFNVTSFGIVSGDFVLDENKVSKFEEWNNTYYKEIKGSLGIRKYELYVDFLNASDVSLYKFGIESPISANEVVRIERLALMDGDIIRVVMEVWDG
ncbi:MAG: hypothetical protein ABIJ18_00315 [archaeon]